MANVTPDKQSPVEQFVKLKLTAMVPVASSHNL